MKQESGDNSQNIQVAGNLSLGVSVSEARQIALDVFKANFYEFSENAAKKALERAEEITDSFIREFYSQIPHLEGKLQEPSIQSSLFNAQKEYAKTGDNDLKNQLLNLLIQRINSDERSLKQIVLDEAITIIQKLTQDQINVLSLIFSAIYSPRRNIIESLESFFDYLNTKLLFFYSNNISYSFFTHLQFTGCCTTLSADRIGSIGRYKSFESIIYSNFKGLFVDGFTEEDVKNEFTVDFEKIRPLLTKNVFNRSALQFNAVNDNVLKLQLEKRGLSYLYKKAVIFQNKYTLSGDEIIEFINSNNGLYKPFIKNWEEKDFKIMRLTSVGFAIAILNYNRVTGENVQLEQFI